jgi:hypothetical protein
MQQHVKVRLERTLYGNVYFYCDYLGLNMRFSKYNVRSEILRDLWMFPQNAGCSELRVEGH